MFEESTNKGIQMGIKQGFEQGIKQGIERGIEQGIALKELFVYQTMLDKGFSIKTIASIFSVSEESSYYSPIINKRDNQQKLVNRVYPQF